MLYEKIILKILINFGKNMYTYFFYIIFPDIFFFIVNITKKMYYHFGPAVKPAFIVFLLVLIACLALVRVRMV